MPHQPDVSLIPSEIATGKPAKERHTYYDEIRSAEPEREYSKEQEPEPEVEPQNIVKD